MSPDKPGSCMACGLDPKSSLALPTLFTSMAEYDSTPHALPQARRFIDQGDKRISELEETIAKLIEFKDTMAHAVQEHRFFSAPIRRVSDDVLLLIFEHVAVAKSSPEFLEERRHYNSLRYKVPWLVAAVCQRWRAVVLERPSFWHKIDFSPIEGKLDTWRNLRLCRRVGLHLARSQSCSTLDISINLDEWERLESTNDTDLTDLDVRRVKIPTLVAATTRLLVAGSHRFYKLSLDGRLPQKFPSADRGFASLKILKISNDEWHRWMNKYFHIGTPNLESLTLENINLDHWTSVCSISTGLRHVEIDNCTGTFRNVFKLLDLSQATLASLQVWMTVPTDESDSDSSEATAEELDHWNDYPSESTVFPQLQDANLSYDGESSARFNRSIMQRLAAPSLQSFSLQWLEEDAIHTLQQFLRHVTQLKQLKLFNASSQIVPLLPHLNALVHLHIDEAVFDLDILFLALTWGASAKSNAPTTGPLDSPRPIVHFLPNLVSLSITMATRVSSTLLEDLVRSRIADEQMEDKPPCLLEKIALEYCRDARRGATFAEPNIQWLRRLKQEGLVDATITTMYRY